MYALEPESFGKYREMLRRNVPLAHYSYSLCGGPCTGMFSVGDGETLAELVKICIESGIPYRVFGGLSNVLVSDRGFDGIVLLNRGGTVSIEKDSAERIIVTADSGVLMSKLVKFCAEEGIAGMDWAAGLPGTVGGAVYGNAGAFGSDTAAVFLDGQYLDESGTLRPLSKADMGFSYRSSALKRGEKAGILTEVRFVLSSGDPKAIRAAADARRTWRHEHQPDTLPSLGSVFKNPEGMSAGKLIRDAGLMGKTIGGAQVSTKHANFITTEKGVRSSDYKALVDLIQAAVTEKFGVKLVPEIEMTGFETE